jgi:hypothetical protein
MECMQKEVGEEGVSKMKEVGGLGLVGASQKKTQGQGWAKKKVIKKLFPEKKN